MLRAFPPSLLVIHSTNTESSSTEKIGSVGLGFDEDLAVISLNLSSTLKKLCMWEKKTMMKSRYALLFSKKH